MQTGLELQNFPSSVSREAEVVGLWDWTQLLSPSIYLKNMVTKSEWWSLIKAMLMLCSQRKQHHWGPFRVIHERENIPSEFLSPNHASVSGPLCKLGSACGLEFIVVTRPLGPTSSISTTRKNGRKAHACVFSTSDEWSLEGSLGRVYGVLFPILSGIHLVNTLLPAWGTFFDGEYS